MKVAVTVRQQHPGGRYQATIGRGLNALQTRKCLSIDEAVECAKVVATNRGYEVEPYVFDQVYFGSHVPPTDIENNNDI